MRNNTFFSYTYRQANSNILRMFGIHIAFSCIISIFITTCQYVMILYTRMFEASTSGCRMPEDGHVSEHICLLSTLFLLVFCKKGPYVDEITCSQIHIDMLPATFRTIPILRFNWYKCDTGVIHESGMYHSLYIMLINTYKAKRDRVIENPAKP